MMARGYPKPLTLCVASLAAAAAFAEPPPPLLAPRELLIVPNALQSEKTPMEVSARGTAGSNAWFFILQDCNGDRRPELNHSGECRSPVESWRKAFDASGSLKEKVDFRARPDIPRDVGLWLSVCAGPTPVNGCTDAYFGVATNSCTLFQTFLDAFTLKGCNPRLHAILGGRRSGSLHVSARMAVHLADTVASPPTSQRVPGTERATGVAWQDASTLLVTVGPAEASGGPDAGVSTGAEPGLYRMQVDGSQRVLLWKALPGSTPLAPVKLDDHRVAFVLEQRAAGAGVSSSLLLWSEQGAPKEIPLRVAVQRLYAVHPEKGPAGLLARAQDAVGTKFLHFDLETGRITQLGYSGSLLHALQRSPTSDKSALDYEDASGDNGWDLALVDPQGKVTAELQVGAGDAHSPAWNPQGGTLAYLAELPR
ncbi:hypothetical protein [Corallococcus exiguus]|uniref:hypothetical protein n=1 Tax=Corallococcus exiguus TaxID=83462 RepID=UPI001493EB0B|nr:hypothetical protein [Corallococcus exiguus]NPD26509.1 hypothetical protein [Corallococcus exiguus]